MATAPEDRFVKEFRQGLERLRLSLENALRALVGHAYPPEVAAVDFEVFPGSWSAPFPARAFFLDKDNNEFFLYVNGAAEYPSPIDPALVQDGVLPLQLEQEIADAASDLQTFSLGFAEFVPWFARAWDAAGGRRFALAATLAEHDSDKEFNLVSGAWQDRYASF